MKPFITLILVALLTACSNEVVVSNSELLLAPTLCLGDSELVAVTIKSSPLDLGENESTSLWILTCFNNETKATNTRKVFLTVSARDSSDIKVTER